VGLARIDRMQIDRDARRRGAPTGGASGCEHPSRSRGSRFPLQRRRFSLSLKAG
jgi:hypothetical protein